MLKASIILALQLAKTKLPAALAECVVDCGWLQEHAYNWLPQFSSPLQPVCQLLTEIDVCNVISVFLQSPACNVPGTLAMQALHPKQGRTSQVLIPLENR